MRRLGCLIIIIVLGIIGYDQIRLEQVRNEVRAISGKLHFGGKAKVGSTDLVTALAAAERHAKNAKLLIRKHKDAEAQAEIDSVLKSLRSANTVSSDIVGDAAEAVGNARDKVVRVFQKAWNDVSEEARPKKHGTGNR